MAETATKVLTVINWYTQAYVYAGGELTYVGSDDIGTGLLLALGFRIERLATLPTQLPDVGFDKDPKTGRFRAPKLLADLRAQLAAYQQAERSRRRAALTAELGRLDNDDSKAKDGAS